MLEFVFKKELLLKIIQESSDPKNGNVVVQLAFEPSVNGKFPARVSAYCEETGVKLAAISPQAIDGCPRPPGCE